MQLLIHLMLAAHLLAMNLASAGPLVAAWMRRRTAIADRAGRQLAWGALAALAIGCLLGGVLLVVPNEGVAAALARFPARAYWFAGGELLFSAACMFWLAATWNSKAGGRWFAGLLAAVSATNLLYHFPPLMAVFGKLVVDPAWAPPEVIERANLLPLMLRAEVLALSVHFALASVVVALVAGMWHLAHANARPGEDVSNGKLPATVQGEDATAIRRLAAAALAITVSQVGVGGWLFTTIESDDRAALLGAALLPTATMMGGLLAAVKLIERLGAAALGDVNPRAVRSAVGWLALTVLLMTSAMWTSRRSDSDAGGAAQQPGRNNLVVATVVEN